MGVRVPEGADAGGEFDERTQVGCEDVDPDLIRCRFYDLAERRLPADVPLFGEAFDLEVANQVQVAERTDDLVDLIGDAPDPFGVPCRQQQVLDFEFVFEDLEEVAFSPQRRREFVRAHAPASQAVVDDSRQAWRKC